MAKGAIDASAVDQGDVIRFHEMAAMVELERVCFPQLVGHDSEFRMVVGETSNDRGEPGLRTGRVENLPSKILARAEQIGGECFSLFGGDGHLVCVSMALETLAVAR